MRESKRKVSAASLLKRAARQQIGVHSTATDDKIHDRGRCGTLVRFETAFDGGYGLSVLADAKEGSQGGSKRLYRVQLGLLASNPVITGVGDWLRSVRSPVWSQPRKKKGEGTDWWGHDVSRRRKKGSEARWLPCCAGHWAEGEGKEGKAAR